MTDGPYTSYDLNSLLKTTTGGKLDVVLATEDNLTGDASRIDVASACVESIFHPSTIGKIFNLVNQGARSTVIDWGKVFSQLDN